MKEGNLYIRIFALILLLANYCALYPTLWLYAQPSTPIDTKEVMDRANHLKKLLDNLLLSPNASSIRGAIKNKENQVKILINKAMEAKVLGENLLNEKKYLEAAVNFQSALEYIFQAIRAEKNRADEGQRIKAKLAEKLKTNETFISAATNVLEEESEGSKGEAEKLLKMAQEARLRAEAKLKEGRGEEAIGELENSTRLAKQAIMLVREGKVLERK